MLYIYVTRSAHRGILKNAWVHVSSYRPEDAGMHTPCITHTVHPVPGRMLDERDVFDAVNAACLTLETASVPYEKCDC